MVLGTPLRAVTRGSPGRWARARADVLCAVTWALAWFIVGALSTDGTLGISALNVTGAFVTDVKS